MVFYRIVKINEYGQKIEDDDTDGQNLTIEPSDPNDYLLKINEPEGKTIKQQKKEYTPIKTYKPSGNLVYDNDILNKIEIIQETVTATQVICDNCGWEWAIKDGGDDLYICHKCGHDNTPKLKKEKRKND